jgi:hypothetical protein
VKEVVHTKLLNVAGLSLGISLQLLLQLRAIALEELVHSMLSLCVLPGRLEGLKGFEVSLAGGIQLRDGEFRELVLAREGDTALLLGLAVGSHGNSLIVAVESGGRVTSLLRKFGDLRDRTRNGGVDGCRLGSRLRESLSKRLGKGEGADLSHGVSCEGRRSR